MNKRTLVGIMVCAVKKYNEMVTLKKKFDLFLNFGVAKGLETNRESASYTKVKTKLRKTL